MQQSTFAEQSSATGNDGRQHAVVVTMEDIRPGDVLLGRGKQVHFHSGNVVFRMEVRSRSANYTVRGYQGKDELARDVIKTVTVRGGRFLRLASNMSDWELCPERLLVNKVKQALRDANRRVARPATTNDAQRKQKSTDIMSSSPADVPKLSNASAEMMIPSSVDEIPMGEVRVGCEEVYYPEETDVQHGALKQPESGLTVEKQDVLSTETHSWKGRSVHDDSLRQSSRQVQPCLPNPVDLDAATVHQPTLPVVRQSGLSLQHLQGDPLRLQQSVLPPDPQVLSLQATHARQIMDDQACNNIRESSHRSVIAQSGVVFSRTKSPPPSSRWRAHPSFLQDRETAEVLRRLREGYANKSDASTK